jgi:hypothetical protein
MMLYDMGAKAGNYRKREKSSNVDDTSKERIEKRREGKGESPPSLETSIARLLCVPREEYL